MELNNMTLQDIVKEFKVSACGEINLESAGLDRYIVDVPFTFDDGDHYVVLLKKEGQNWVLSDEGHTLMHLSYDLRDKEYEKGNRQKIIDEVLNSHQIRNVDGELVLTIPQSRYGDALFTFVQVITKITDVTFLTRELVKTTFQEDFSRLVSEKSEELGIKNVFNYTNPLRDPHGLYPIDVRLNGVTSKQIFIFAIDSDTKCQSATIVLHQWREWQEKFYSIAIFSDWMNITRLHLYRIQDVLNKQLVSYDRAQELLKRELEDNIIVQK
jgi:hypothetical protein